MNLFRTGQLFGSHLVAPHQDESEPRQQSGFLSLTMDYVTLRQDKCSAVINLSFRIFSDVEHSVLSKGMNYCPVPKQIDLNQLKLDLKQFSRRGFFSSAENEFSTVIDDQIVSNDCAAFKPKSDFTPPANRDRQLDAYITAVENATMTGASQTRPDDFHHNRTGPLGCDSIIS